MYQIGIDVGSAYTKYCVLSNGKILSLHAEKTPIRQKEYFNDKIEHLMKEYPSAEIVSCGYGKKNASDINSINELTALAKGAYFVTKEDGFVLDIGGQDTKIISQVEGRLKCFFINDKCAAGSGMFLSSTLDMVGVSFDDICIDSSLECKKMLSSTCAVFAQSEIVELIANNWSEEEILRSVLCQIFVKAKILLSKVDTQNILLSGGISQINGIDKLASKVLGIECAIIDNSRYLSAIGCAIYDNERI